MSTHADEIDALLARYLYLLDEYTGLRAELSALLSSAHQDLARANYSAERGVRYGADFYDERMQAERVVKISVPGDGRDGVGTGTTTGQVDRSDRHDKADVPNDEELPTPRYTVTKPSDSFGEKEEHDRVSQEKIDGDKTDETRSVNDDEAAPGDGRHDPSINDSKPDGHRQTQLRRDPLRWFGLLVPQTLRTVQRNTIKAVEDVIPRLAVVDAEMREVEIRVRRARKLASKAEKTKEKAMKDKGTIGDLEEVANGSVAVEG